MSAQRISDEKSTLIPSLARGEDRRGERRDDKDWRISPRSYGFCGAIFDPLTPMQTLARCKWITTDHAFRYIVTPNVDHVVRLNKEAEVYQPLYQASWLSVCDSRILELLANLSGIPLKAVPGSDLTAQVFDNLIDPNEPINVIGADDDVIANVRERYGLKKLKNHQPPMGLRHNPDAIAKAAQFIAKNPTRYTFICVGSPQQEMVAKAAAEHGACVGLGLCVGASLDFLAGKVKRAPKWMQFLRMEWLYRLLSEPRRLWSRYLVDGPKIFWIWLKWTMRRP